MVQRQAFVKVKKVVRKRARVEMVKRILDVAA